MTKTRVPKKTLHESTRSPRRLRVERPEPHRITWLGFTPAQARLYERIRDRGHVFITNANRADARPLLAFGMVGRGHVKGRPALLLERPRRPNPTLVPGPPPTYLFGLPTSSVWAYRGRQISILERSRPERHFVACYHDDEGDEDCARGTDVHAALANARYQIDLEELSQDWFDADRAVHTALDYMVDQTMEPINRGRVARTMQVLSGKPGTTYRIRPSQMEAFYRLPLDDRLRLIDAVIDYQEHAGMFEPNQRIPNPEVVGTMAELLM